MKESHTPRPLIDEKERETSLEKMFDWIRQNNLTSDEIEFAYYVSLGVTPEELGKDSEMSSSVKELLNIMSDYQNKRFPVTDIVNVIERMRGIEDSKIPFYELIDELNLTEKEKDILRSIVLKKRSGSLVVVNGQGRDVGRIEIKKEDTSDSDSDQLADKLSQMLSKYKDDAVEIRFEL